MSLRNGLDKMSKSDPSDYSRIMIRDPAKIIDQKIKKAKTDSEPVPDNIDNAKSRPEALNLITIFAAVNNLKIDDVINEYGNKEFSFFKNKLSESLVNLIEPIGSEMNKLLDDKNYLDKIINEGSLKASEIAKPVINEVYQLVGLLKT